MKRRTFLSAFALSYVSALAGCSSDIISMQNIYKSRTYHETVYAFLFSEDGRHLIVLGEHHHYIFPASDGLIKTLQSSFRSSLSAEFGTFRIKSGAAEGDFVLQLRGSASPREKAEAISVGFQPSSDGSLSLSGRLTGNAYSTEKFDSSTFRERFKLPYHVEVNESRSVTEKILLTPVALATDGALIVVGIPVALVLLPIAQAITK